MAIVRAGLSEREALLDLAAKVQANVEPVLTTDELRQLLPLAAVVDASGHEPDAWARWLPNEPYAAGDLVTPVVRNGFVYEVTVAGESGATEPVWPTTIGDTVVDGAVTWRCADTAPWMPTYSRHRLNVAAAEGWRRKAGRLAGKIDFAMGETRFAASQLHKHCLEMAATFARRGGAGSVPLIGRTASETGAAVTIDALVVP